MASEFIAAAPGDWPRLFPGAQIHPYRDRLPRIAGDAFIAPGAVVIGDVEIGPKASIWYGCVLRGDDHHIRIGARSNVQDGSIVHVTLDEHATEIGEDVTVGHAARLHGCTLADGCLVGIGAIVLDGAVVEREAFVAAGALVTPNKRVASGQLWGGSPAKPLRDLKPADLEFMCFDAAHYVRVGQEYRALNGAAETAPAAAAADD